MNNRTIIKMASNGLVEGIELKDQLTTTSIYPGCVYDKIHRLPFESDPHCATQVGEIIHYVCGPLQPPSPNGSRYLKMTSVGVV
jgi:hypothetical protein